MILVAVAILVGVYVAATGRGGELAYEQADHAPLDLGPVSATDVAMLRPPTALWGYNMQVTDEALERIAGALRERDLTIAYLQHRLTGPAPDPMAPDPVAPDRVAPDLMAPHAVAPDLAPAAPSARTDQPAAAATPAGPPEEAASQEPGETASQEPGETASQELSPPELSAWEPSPREPSPRESVCPGAQSPRARPVSDRGPVPGPDGALRCPWALSAPEYLAYHDQEWGRPVRGDAAIFERLCLEAFQSGLSWLTILRKRENFRAAFAGFDAVTVARFGDEDVARLMADAGIVRNRAKINAAITNARAAVGLPGGLTALVWKYAGQAAAAPRTLADVPPATPASKALAAELKGHGFTFTGPVTAYATMQACGIVNDHLADCVARDTCAAGTPDEALSCTA